MLAAGAGFFIRARHRRRQDVMWTNEPVSSDWLARARGRDEQQW